MIQSDMSTLKTSPIDYIYIPYFLSSESFDVVRAQLQLQVYGFTTDCDRWVRRLGNRRWNFMRGTSFDWLIGYLYKISPMGQKGIAYL